MEVHHQLVARRFVLVDEEDNPVAYITGAEAGFVGLHVEGSGDEEEPFVRLGFKAGSRTPIIHMRGPEGGGVHITVAESGQAAILLEDADGAKRVTTT